MTSTTLNQIATCAHCHGVHDRDFCPEFSVHLVADRLVHAHTPPTDEAREWVDSQFPEGDGYVEHTASCDSASYGDACVGGCPVYVTDDSQEG